MASNVSDIRKIGRPKIGATPVTVRLPPAQLAALDAWIAVQPTPVSRPEAIRAMVQASLQLMDEG